MMRSVEIPEIRYAWNGDVVMLHLTDPGGAVVATVDIADELPAAAEAPGRSALAAALRPVAR